MKYYTSKVSYKQSISAAEDALVDAGARRIQKEFAPDGSTSAIYFELPIGDTFGIFRLPARVDSAYKILRSKRKSPTSETDKTDKAQALRTAWKLISEWCEIQCTMVKLEQAEALEIFMPYLYDPTTNQTAYQVAKSGGFQKFLGS